MTERGMADIVDQGQSLNQIHVQAELGSNGTCDLRDFNGVSQPVAEVVRVAAGENLGFGFESAKCSGVYDPVTVALEVVAIGMRGFRITPPARLLHVHGVIGQHGKSLTLAVLDGATGVLARHSIEKSLIVMQRKSLLP
jgi:hypothetical protein